MKHNNEKPGYSIIWTSTNRGIAFWIMEGNIYYMEVDGVLVDEALNDETGIVHEELTRFEGTPLTLVEDSQQVSFSVTYYGWYQGSDRFNKAFENDVVIVSHSVNEVIVIRMNLLTLELIDAQKRTYPEPINDVTVMFLPDGQVKLAIWRAIEASDGERTFEFVDGPERQ